MCKINFNSAYVLNLSKIDHNGVVHTNNINAFLHSDSVYFITFFLSIENRLTINYVKYRDNIAG